MLDAKDLEAISLIVRTEIKDSEDRMEQKMDQKLGTLEKRMDQKLDTLEKRMDQKMDQKLSALEKRMDQKMDQKLKALEKRMDKKMDKRIADSENLILGELDRVQIQMNGRMDKMEKHMNEIDQYYRINRLNNETVTLILEKVDGLDKRVTNLENVVYA